MRAKPAPCSMNRTNTRAGRLARPRRINARRVSFLQRLNLNPEEVIEIDLEADELQAPKLSCRRTSCCSGSTRRCTCWQLFIPNQLYWGWSSPSVPSILLPQDEPPHSSYPGGYQKIWDRGCVKNPQVKRMIPQRHSPPSSLLRMKLPKCSQYSTPPAAILEVTRRYETEAVWRILKWRGWYLRDTAHHQETTDLDCASILRLNLQRARGRPIGNSAEAAG